MSVDTGRNVEILEKWFQSKCDGNWENFFGVTIETTDNPGWWIRISGVSVDRLRLAKFVGRVLADYGAQISFDETTLRVFASDLSQALAATAVLVTEKVVLDEKIRAPNRHG